MNIPQRLEILRLKKGLSWDELGKELDLSRSMLHYVRKSEREMSDRALYRLEELERASGIEPPVTYPRGGSLAVVMSDAPPKNLIAKLERLADNLQAQLDELRQAINELKS